MSAAKPNPTPGEPPNYDLSIPEPAIPAGLELLQAHIYFRHGERTPVKERLTHLGIPSRWNMCTAGKEFAVGVLNDPDTRSQKSELMLLRKRVERGGSGSSSSLGDISECSWGELTDLGRLSTMRLGKQLRARYVDNLGFLPSTISAADADKIYLRSTPVPRAFESLQQALHGLYPTQDPSHIPQIAQRTFDDEALLPTSGCATAKALDAQYKKEAAVKYNHELEVLDSKIAGLVGVPVRIDSHPSANGVFDTIKAAQAHGLKVPSVFEDSELSSIMEGAIVKEWFSGYASRQWTRLVMGRLFSELNDQFDRKAEGQSPLKIALYACHDTSIAGMLHGIRAFDNKWPAFTAYLSFELFKKEATQAQPSQAFASILGSARPRHSDKDLFVRTRYNDRDVHIPACAAPGKHLDGTHGAVCTLQAFKEAVGDISISAEEWKKACRRPLEPELTR